MDVSQYALQGTQYHVDVIYLRRDQGAYATPTTGQAYLSEQFLQNKTRVNSAIR